MDLFSGWSSPLIYSKAIPTDNRNNSNVHHHSTTSSSHNGNSSARNYTDNPLLFFSNQQKLGTGNLSFSISNQQREQIIHPHISPSLAARSHSVQFSNHPHIIQQANETQANFGDDHDEHANNDISSANAWAQNRCLLCLLYEEKLRVMQKRIHDLLSSGLTEGNIGMSDGVGRKKIHSSSDVANVSHSTIVADPKKFLELLAQKDREIEEAAKSAQHVSIDRDNLRAALDDAEMKLEIALRKLQEYENNGTTATKSFRNANRLNQPSLVSTTNVKQDERSFSAASNGDDGNKNNKNLWTKLGPGEQIRRIHAQEQLGVDDDEGNAVSIDDNFKQPLLKTYSKNNSTVNNNNNNNDDLLITTSSLSEILSTRRREATATSSSQSQRTSPFVKTSSASQHKKNNGNLLTRDIADEQLGMFPEHNLQDAPSSLSRLGPLPKPSSLRMGAIDPPSEDSWKLGGRKPGLIDMNAKGTPAKGNNNNNSAQDVSSALLRLHYGNISNNNRSASSIHHQNQNNNHDTEFSIHSPHYGSFAPQ